MTKQSELAEPAPQPCSQCPWRIANQGKRHAHGFYSQSNLRRLWNGLRTGNAPGMTCHPTDPRMAEFEGYEKTAERDVTNECTGALVLIYREVKRFEAICLAVNDEEKNGAKLPRNEARRRYQTATNRVGMTRGALADWVWTLMVQRSGSRSRNVTEAAFKDPAIGYGKLPQC